MLLDEPISCFINKEEVVFDEEEKETLSCWTMEQFKVGGFACHQSVVEVASNYNKCVYVLNIYPNQVGQRDIRIYFELDPSWLSKYFVLFLWMQQLRIMMY
jgi:hypothetical protein